ncbi:MAG: GDP-mannose 4,6-dehydratase, partial [Chitinophagaceae bacterium]
RGVAEIVLGLKNKLYLGNLNAQRDWGHARDYIEAMWLILQQEEAEDFVIATGVTTPVRDFVKMSFAHAGVELVFEGKDEDERGIVAKVNDPSVKLEVGDVVVAVDKRYFRPTEVDLLLGDPTKANTKLGWMPKYDVNMLCKEMVDADLELFKKDLVLNQTGYKTTRNYE